MLAAAAAAGLSTAILRLASISKRGLFLVVGVGAISLRVCFFGVATPAFLGGFCAFVAAFPLVLVPLEEGGLARDGFFFGASSSLPSAFGLRRLDVRDGFFSGGASSSLKNSLGLRRPILGIVRAIW